MTAHILTLVNLVLSFALGWSAMCRLAAMHHRVRLRYAGVYVLLFVLSFLHGMQFFIFGQFADLWDVGLSLILCVLLWADLPSWRGGPPAHSLIR